jgi:PST family polysaccharide transporter
MDGLSAPKAPIVPAAAARMSSNHQGQLKPKDKPSYGEILKSSALVGGASAVTLLIGIVRTKALAVMLGPSGFGLMGAFMSIVDFMSGVANVGINRSGVRQIAESVGSGDIRRIAVTVTVLRRTASLLGVAGGVLLALVAVPVAQLSFGHTQYSPAIVLLGAAVLLKIVADAQSALIQGMRRIADLAKVGVLGSIFGSVAAIPLVYFMRESGVALSIVAAAAATLWMSWWYSRKVRVERVRLTIHEMCVETKALLKLGLAFMVSGFLMIGAAYLVRVILLRLEGLESAGLYQAAWTLGGMYVGLIIQAMGADFYPRLVAAASDDAVCNRLVNEQMQVSLLLASVGVLGTLVLAPFVLELFYSTHFTEAAHALRWICLGMALRVISWPMGYIIVARGDQRLFVLTEVAWTIVNVTLSYFLVAAAGLTGAGAAFFLSYVFHMAMIYPVVRWLSGFRLDSTSKRTILLFGSVTGCAFGAFLVLPPAWAYGIAVTSTCVGCAFALRMLFGLFHPDAVPRQLRWLYQLLHQAR